MPAESSSNEIRLTASGSPAGRFTLCVQQGLLRVTAEGEPIGQDLLVCFRRAQDAGWLQPNMRTLVDLTRFTGVIDWPAIHAIKRMAPWGTDPGPAPRTAYLVRDTLTGMVVKVLSLLFPRSRHRLFLNEAEALAWLHAPETPPSHSTPELA
ncbi:MAG: hypothetical protein ABSH19_00285 [Opitutales bacterium]